MSGSKGETKQCFVCGKTFATVTHNQINCTSCRSAYNNFVKHCTTPEQKKVKIDFIKAHRCGVPGKLQVQCDRCGKPILASLSRSMQHNYCMDCTAEIAHEREIMRLTRKCRRCGGRFIAKPNETYRTCPACREEIAAKADKQRRRKFPNHEISVRALQSRAIGKTYGYGAPLIDSGTVTPWTEAEYSNYVIKYRKDSKK